MRELTANEILSVSGGFKDGTKIPFMMRFISTPNWPGPVSVLTGVGIAWSVGTAIGNGINSFNNSFSGMSLGVAIYRIFNGGSRINKRR